MRADLLEQIEATTKRAPKERLLAQMDEQGQRLVKKALDPDITFGITVDEDEALASRSFKAGFTAEGAEWWHRLEAFLEQAQVRHITGGDAQNAMWALLKTAPGAKDLKWACRILNRDLRAGFDIRTFNKVFGEGAIQKFEVQLAETYDPDRHELKGLWFFQPKLDGNRVVMIDGKPMSRGGKVYPNCESHIAELLGHDPFFFSKWVLDGEMMGNLGFDQSSGALRRSSGKGKKADFTYWVFDIIDRREWEERKTRVLLYRRTDCFEFFKRFKSDRIKMVPYGQIHDPTHRDVARMCDGYVADGFEGAMAKDAQSGYVWDRGHNLLKVKKFYDADLKVVELYEGRNQHKGSLGGFIVEGTIDGRPCRSKVGSGFGHRHDPKEPGKVLRQDVWRNPKDWIGAVVQVQYQDFTKDGSLRFPVFIMRRRDKE